MDVRLDRYLAEWIVFGQPPYDLIELDADRYGPWTDAAFTLAKVRESYGRNNAVTWPRDERPAGRPCRGRVGPLHRRLADRGAQFGFRAGWEQPVWFAGPADQPGHMPSFRRTNWSVRAPVSCNKKKVFPYSLPLPSVGPGADPGVQAVSLQVT